MRRVLKITAVLLVLVAVAVTALLFVEIDSPRLGRALLTQIGRQAGVRMDAASFRLNLLKGLRLGEVRFETEGPSGKITATAA